MDQVLCQQGLKPGEEIGDEVHRDRDQFFRIETGNGRIVIDGASHAVKSDDAIMVPAGSRHNLINVGETPLKLFSIYGPPNHIDQLIQETKAEASVSKEVFAGATTE